MANNLQRLFSHLPAREPQDGLLSVIMERIEAESVRAAKRRLIIFSAGCIGSLTALVPVFMMMRTNIIESGFAEFFSLLFSDAGSVATYWQNFFLTLLESLPAVSMAAFLATVFALLGSLRFLTRDVQLLYGHH